MSNRLLFVISSYSAVNTGQGGHYYSVRDVARAVAMANPDWSVEILSLGDIFPKPLQGGQVPVTHIDFSSRSTADFVSSVLAFGDKFMPTHVHAFDNKSYFFARWIARRSSAKRYVTKPGGPNAGRYFPKVPDVICFSNENLFDLRSRRRLRSTRLHYLPQRMLEPRVDVRRVSFLRDKIGESAVLLRICRIGSYYRQSLLQTLNLARVLRGSGLDVSAVIVGVVEDSAVLAELHGELSEHDHVFTDEHLTRNASELLPAAHAVVGTGRGLVEAAMAGRVLFTPLAGAELPVLLSRDNWEELAATNFSERNVLTKSEPPPLLDVISQMREPVDIVANEIASHYSLDGAMASYREVYAATQPKERASIDFLLNSVVVAVPLLKSRKAA